MRKNNEEKEKDKGNSFIDAFRKKLSKGNGLSMDRVREDDDVTPPTQKKSRASSSQIQVINGGAEGGSQVINALTNTFVQKGEKATLKALKELV